MRKMLSLSVIALAVAASAFTTDKKTVPATLQSAIWYDFSGNASQLSDLSKYAVDPNNSGTTLNCLGSNLRCEIKAVPIQAPLPNAGKPDLATIQTETKHP